METATTRRNHQGDHRHRADDAVVPANDLPPEPPPQALEPHHATQGTGARGFLDPANPGSRLTESAWRRSSGAPRVRPTPSRRQRSILRTPERIGDKAAAEGFVSALKSLATAQACMEVCRLPPFIGLILKQPFHALSSWASPLSTMKPKARRKGSSVDAFP